jgi:hypothetical protein
LNLKTFLLHTLKAFPPPRLSFLSLSDDFFPTHSLILPPHAPQPLALSTPTRRSADGLEGGRAQQARRLPIAEYSTLPAWLLNSSEAMDEARHEARHEASGLIHEQQSLSTHLQPSPGDSPCLDSLCCHSSHSSHSAFDCTPAEARGAGEGDGQGSQDCGSVGGHGSGGGEPQEESMAGYSTRAQARESAQVPPLCFPLSVQVRSHVC